MFSTVKCVSLSLIAIGVVGLVMATYGPRNVFKGLAYLTLDEIDKVRDASR